MTKDEMLADLRSELEDAATELERAASLVKHLARPLLPIDIETRINTMERTAEDARWAARRGR